MPRNGLPSTKLVIEKALNIREPEHFHELREDFWVFNNANSNVLNFYENKEIPILKSKSMDFLKGQRITGITSQNNKLFIAAKQNRMQNFSPSHSKQSIYIVDLGHNYNLQLNSTISDVFSKVDKPYYHFYSVSLAVSNELLFCASKRCVAIYHYPSGNPLSEFKITAPYNNPKLYSTDLGIVANFGRPDFPKNTWHVYTAQPSLNKIQSHSYKPKHNYSVQFQINIGSLNYILAINLFSSLIRCQIYNYEGIEQTAFKFSLPRAQHFSTVLESGNIILADTNTNLSVSYRCSAIEDFAKPILVAFWEELLAKVPLPPCITQFVLLPFLLSHKELTLLEICTNKTNVHNFFQPPKSQSIQKPGEIKEVCNKSKSL